MLVYHTNDFIALGDFAFYLSLESQLYEDDFQH